MYVLGFLAIQFGPRPLEAQGADAPAWKKLLGDSTALEWLEKSAQAGYPRAIESVCRMGEDRLAPAAMRDAKAAQCAELRAKYPAK
jgi:hypothetical protein